jgi:hypothetical protein
MQWGGLWTLEYNQLQDKFHIETADTKFQASMEDFVNNEFKDNMSKLFWYTLGIFNSYEECENYKDWIVNVKKDKLRGK